MHNEDLWVWRINIGAVQQFLKARGLKHIHRGAGEFTEIQRAPGDWREVRSLRCNNAWWRLRLPAGPATANLLIFEKPATGS